MSLLDYLEKAIDKFYAVMPRKKPFGDTETKAKLIAHRGAHDHTQGYIENTLPAFERAESLGCWGIEFDVQVTADDVPIVHHDLNFSRLFNQDERVDKVRWSEFEAKVPAVPTLEQVIHQFGKKQTLFIELKESFRHYDQLKVMLSHLEPGKDYYIISLDEAILEPLKQIPREAQLLIPVHNNVSKFCQMVVDEAYGGVLGHYLFLTNKHIRRLVQADKIYGVGFVDSKRSLYRELSRQVPWIFTNNAEAVAVWLKLIKETR